MILVSFIWFWGRELHNGDEREENELTSAEGNKELEIVLNFDPFKQV
ncbi:hypothetical protein QA612_04730 [Evansella sp. AB-P1]|nr:hypothetical protein [Evansella sp. AB-P1]MDG5786787.1 hypothetical protein [Evansella sp. AB-P1]